ncbi:hypothetical protein R3P38DRAFT_3229693 [Favolaschia claudopus]|uniref:Uncharacterized protein n=1 Tax=Favolaschia claudopus TaxID=2862362 RepID=A0AAV9ZP21_9AGAR
MARSGDESHAMGASFLVAIPTTFSATYSAYGKIDPCWAESTFWALNSSDPVPISSKKIDPCWAESTFWALNSSDPVPISSKKIDPCWAESTFWALNSSDPVPISSKKGTNLDPELKETTQASELTAAELEVSETLAQMQADRTQVSFHDAGGNSPTWRANAEIAIDKEITALWEEGERICPSDSDDEEGMEDLGETTKTDRNRVP